MISQKNPVPQAKNELVKNPTKECRCPLSNLNNLTFLTRIELST